MVKGILLSGGMDSIALCYLIKPEFAFTINYGQRPAEKEISVSNKICGILNIRSEIISIDCSTLGSGELVGNKSLEISPSSEWWPFRNQLLVTLAAMKALSLGVDELILGSVRTDSFHSDGTKEFYDKINDLVSYQEGEIKISCPAITYTSSELIKLSKIPMEILLWAHSCHTSNVACGICPGCLKQLRVRQDLNLDF